MFDIFWKRFGRRAGQRGGGVIHPSLQRSAWRTRVGHSAGRCVRFEPLEPRLVLDSTVVFNEIMYNPPEADQQLEWIELHNQMSVDMDISGWRLDGGVEFSFIEGTVVPGGGYLVVAADPAALQAASGLATMLGPLRGNLANEGERLELRNNSDRIMDAVEYVNHAPWPVAPDGSGATLAKWDSDSASQPAENWTASNQVGGTPGAQNFPLPADGPIVAAPPAGPLVFSEIASANASTFQVELANIGPAEIDTAGYVIGSSAQSHPSYTVPAQPLAPGDRLVLSDADLGFAAEAGEKLYLYTPDQAHVVDARVVTNRLRGRAETRDGAWLFPTAPTFGTANQFDFHTEVVINEIMYHPRDTSVDGEWIELFNRSDHPVDLGGWKLREAVDYEIPGGTTLGAGQYLVVAQDAQALASRYPGIADRIVGDFFHSLANANETILLTDAHGNPADKVHYFDGGRWPYEADGHGASLELRDPDADNAVAEAWSASDEGLRSTWQTYTYGGPGTNVGNDPQQYHEFLLGLLDAGEVLLDDISVIEDPGGPDARELIQNGTFETDTLGTTPAAWRIIGTQHGVVEADPGDPANTVLHLTATGPTEHMHNNAGTTLKAGTEYVHIDPALQYEISFRAKWLAGSNQLNTRLYFNRLGRTTLVDVPDQSGTPGQRNSTWQENAGPTYVGLRHGPVVPAAGEEANVSVAAQDPDGIARMTLWYSVEENPFEQVAMTLGHDGRYVGTVPGQEAADRVQFYVQGEDTLGAVTTFPAAGPDSRALYVVQDDRGGPGPARNFRILMTASDAVRLHEKTNVMSNDRMGTTVIYDDREVFYDVGVRLKGSERGRDQRVRVGFNIQFDPQQLFRGVHETVAIDRSGAGNQYSQKEIAIKHAINHAGQLPSMYDDIVYVVTPNDSHTGSALLSMARYNDVFLDSQYANGSQGTAFEYELIYYPLTTVDGDVEGLKIPEPDSVVGVSLRNLGPDKEAYRWHWIIKNNRREDDYSALIAAVTAMGQPAGPQFHADTQRLLDVDEWLRAFAIQILFGIGDNYATGAAHNLQVYARPSDGKSVFLPWDMDFTFSQGVFDTLTPNADLRKLLTDPGNEHAYYGHILDIVNTTANQEYMAPWLAHYGTFLTHDDLTGRGLYIKNRGDFALAQLPGYVPFRVTPATIDVGAATTATISGDGWVNVRQIRLAGSDEPLALTWNAVTGWQATVPVDRSMETLTFEAFDFQGQRVGSDTVQVHGTPDTLHRPLAITEINYNPFAPTARELAVDPNLDNDDFEFVELRNVGDHPLDLAGVRFTDGIQYVFPQTTLEAGQFAVIARDGDAFRLRYGDEIPVLGEFAGGRLNNGGETVELTGAAGETLVQFTYGDGGKWPGRADGKGATLEVIDTQGDYNDPENWRSSSEYGGTPGRAGAGPVVDVIVNEVLARDAAAGPDLVELYNTTDHAVDLSGWYLSDRGQDLARWRLANGTRIGARAYLVLTADDVGFTLEPQRSGDLWLTKADPASEMPVRFADHVTFDAMAAGVSAGRWANGDPAAALFPMIENTFGTANSGPVQNTVEVVISEVHYHPRILQLDQNFDSGTADGLSPIKGQWSAADGSYHVVPTAAGEDTVATVVAPGMLMGDTRISATFANPIDTPFLKNAAVIFDYQSPEDFKFAALFAAGGRWRIGQHDAQGWHFLADSSKNPVDLESDHEIVVQILGSVVVLQGDGLERARYDFGSILSTGLVGIGSKGSEVDFKHVVVEPLDDERALEFLELQNTTDGTIDVGGWRVEGGVQLFLPLGTEIPAQQSIVAVGFDPADPVLAAVFRDAYRIDASVPMVGPYAGSLSNAGESVRLVRPIDSAAPWDEQTLVDRVAYEDQPPWPTAADGFGASLTRTTFDAFGIFAFSWAAAGPTPGGQFTAVSGDANLNGQVDVNDVDAFVLALSGPTAYQARFGVSATFTADIDQDGDVDVDDIDDFVTLLGNAPAARSAAVPKAVPAVPLGPSANGESGWTTSLNTRRALRSDKVEDYSSHGLSTGQSGSRRAGRLASSVNHRGGTWTKRADLALAAGQRWLRNPLATDLPGRVLGNSPPEPAD